MVPAMKKILLIVVLSLVTNFVFAKMHKEEIIYKHGDVNLKSYVYWDDAFGDQRPGILVLPEQWGMSDYITLRAEMLAESGYVALAVDLYGDARVTRKQDEASAWKAELTKDIGLWRQRTQLAFEQLLSHEHVERDKTAAIGYGLGGSSVLQLAYSGASIGGIVDVHGAVPTTSLEDAGKIQARLLVLLGGIDPYVSKSEAIKATEIYSKTDVDWEMVIYGLAKHSFTNPYADGYGVDAHEYHLDADQRAWARILSFLESLFEDE